MKSNMAKMAFIVAVSVLTSSCSYVTMQRPETLDPEKPVCVSNRLAPTIDSMYAVGNGLSVIGSTIGSIAQESTRVVSKPVPTGVLVGAVVAGIGSTAIWSASAASGFNRAEECEQLKEDYFSRNSYSRPSTSYDTSTAERSPSSDRTTSSEPRESVELNPSNGSSTPDNSRERIDTSKYMAVIEAAMHCGSSRRDILDKVDEGTFETHSSQNGVLILKSDVKEECGEEPEVSVD